MHILKKPKLLKGQKLSLEIQWAYLVSQELQQLQFYTLGLSRIIPMLGMDTMVMLIPPRFFLSNHLLKKLRLYQKISKTIKFYNFLKKQTKRENKDVKKT